MARLRCGQRRGPILARMRRPSEKDMKLEVFDDRRPRASRANWTAISYVSGAEPLVSNGQIGGVRARSVEGKLPGGWRKSERVTLAGLDEPGVDQRVVLPQLELGTAPRLVVTFEPTDRHFE